MQGASGGESCTFVKTWRLYDEGSNATPVAIATDLSGNVYLAETGRNRIAQYSSDGSSNMWWDLRDAESGTAAHPAGIAVDTSGAVYFTDRRNDTITKLTVWKREVWGSEGDGNGQFSDPGSIVVAPSNNIYVADTGNNRIQNIHSTGNWLRKWESYGTSYGTFNAPGAITVDAAGHIYVTDAGNCRVQKFTHDGTFLAKWGNPGSGNGEFQTPSGIAVNSWGNIYVTDLSSRIQEFSPAGEYLSTCNASGSISAIAIGPSGAMYVLSQSGAVWKIDEFKIPSSNLSPTPEKRRTFSVVTPRTTVMPAASTASATVQNTPVQAQIRVSPGTGPSVAANESPATGITSSIIPPGGNTTTGAAGNQSTGEVSVTGRQKGIFEGISGFLRDVLG